MEQHSPPTSELQVVRGCLSGDADSYTDFVDLFRQTIYRLCYRLLRHHEDAEDVMQETLVRALGNLHQWDQTRPLRPWIMTIASNCCKTLLAKRVTSRVQSGQQLADLAPQREEPREAKEDLAEEIHCCLQKLRPEIQECFLLFYRDQLTVMQIAEQSGHPVGTVKIWLHRSRQHLAEALRRRGVQQ